MYRTLHPSRIGSWLEPLILGTALRSPGQIASGLLLFVHRGAQSAQFRTHPYTLRQFDEYVLPGSAPNLLRGLGPPAECANHALRERSMCRVVANCASNI